MGWERLDHVELSSAGDTLSSGTFTAKKNLKVIISIKASGATESRITVNSDTSASYANRYSENNGTDATGTSQAYMIGHDINGGSSYCVMHIKNIADQEKIIMKEFVSNVTGAGNAPNRSESISKWVNTSNQITSIQVTNVGGGDFDSGSYITVLGAKEAVVADSISVTGMEVKKHLMVQGKIIHDGQLNTVALQFNNDTGNNYSRRYSINGGSDATDTSQPSFEIEQGSAWSGDCFFTAHIINEADKEKLGISEWVDQNAAGVGNAPRRAEVVGKWANTSNAITSVKLIQDGSGDFAEGSEVTVYGTD